MMKLTKQTRVYLIENLAPALSSKFAINLQDVEEVIQTFDYRQPVKTKGELEVCLRDHA
jgi:hypothetical protein